MPSQRGHCGRGELDRAKGDSGELVSVRVTVAVMLIGQYCSAKIRRDDAAGKTMGETVSKVVKAVQANMPHAVLHSPSACAL